MVKKAKQLIKQWNTSSISTMDQNGPDQSADLQIYASFSQLHHLARKVKISSQAVNVFSASHIKYSADSSNNEII